MTEIPKSISNLTNEELRKQLLAAGIAPAPLTPTTIRIFQRKLAKKLASTLPVRNLAEQLDQEAKENVKPQAEAPKCGGIFVSRYGLNLLYLKTFNSVTNI